MIIKNKNAKYKIERSQSLYKDQKGFTLVEMLIAVALSITVMGGVYEVFTSQQKAFRIQDHVAEMQQNARVALDMMTREIRMAGYIPEEWDGDSSIKVPTFGATVVGAQDIEVLGLNTITFEADIDGDGKTETVRYSIDAANLNLTREVWEWDGGALAWGVSGKPQPLAENIEKLTFIYCDDAPCFDTSATETTTSSSIRLIQIQITAKTGKKDPNLKGGDGYRRRTLTANVRPRNLGL